MNTSNRRKLEAARRAAATAEGTVTYFASVHAVYFERAQARAEGELQGSKEAEEFTQPVPEAPQQLFPPEPVSRKRFSSRSC